MRSFKRDYIKKGEALFVIQVLIKRCRGELGIDDKDLRIMTNIHYNETANIKVDNQLIEAIR